MNCRIRILQKLESWRDKLKKQNIQQALPAPARRENHLSELRNGAMRPISSECGKDPGTELRVSSVSQWDALDPDLEEGSLWDQGRKYGDQQVTLPF